MLVPEQLIPESQKNRDWCCKTAMGIARTVGGYDSVHGNSKKAYDLYYGLQNAADFEYLTGEGEFRMPASVRMIPISRPYFDILLSTAESRPFEPVVHAVDDGSVNEKATKLARDLTERVFSRVNARQLQLSMANMQLDALKQQIEQAQQPQQGPNGEPGQPVDPQTILSLKMAEMQYGQVQQQIQRGATDVQTEIDYLNKRSSRSSQAEYEHQVGLGLEYLYYKHGYRETFLKGFESSLVLDQEIYCIDDIQDGLDPVVRWVNPMSVYYGMSADAQYLDECPWVMEDRYLPPQQVIAEYGGLLNPADLAAISGEKYTLSNGWDMYLGSSFNSAPVGSANGCYTGITAAGGGMSMGSQMIRVRRVAWQAPRRLRAKQSQLKSNPDVVFTHIISDNEKIKKDDKEIERYVNDWWEATIIGTETIVKDGPCAFQHRDIQDVGRSFGPYIGHAYNGIDRRPYSRILAIEGIITLYNLVYYQMELLIALSGIKGFIMDKSQMPKGMSMKEWYYNLKQGVGIIDTSREKMRNSQAGYNQFQTIDMTFGNSLGQLQGVLDRLDGLIGRVLGIPPQRMGEVDANDQVGTTKQANIQSNITTEVIFYKHDRIRKRVMDRVLNVLPHAWKEGRRGQFVAGQFGQKMFQLKADDLLDRSFEVFFVDGGKEQRIMDMTTQMLMNEYQTRGTISLGQLVQTFSMTNLRELQETVEQFDKVAQQNMTAQQQAQAQDEQQKMQLQQQYEMAMRKQATDGERMKGELDSKRMQLEATRAQMEMANKASIVQNQENTRKEVADQNTMVELSYLQEQRRATDIDAQFKRLELLLNSSAANAQGISSPRRKNNISDL